MYRCINICKCKCVPTKKDVFIPLNFLGILRIRKDSDTRRRGRGKSPKTQQKQIKKKKKARILLICICIYTFIYLYSMIYIYIYIYYILQVFLEIEENKHTYMSTPTKILRDKWMEREREPKK